MGGWQEEVYYSLYEVGRLKQLMELPDEEVLAAYEAASQALPSRIEALHDASRLCRLKGRFQQGYEIAKRGLGQPYAPHTLFGRPWMYETGLLDEFAVNAYWAGHHADCLDACLQILATGKLAGSELQRVVANAKFALQKLITPASNSTPS
jgi:hypothetical protein